uniref:High affinity immunoglobulin gamma Fc receptor I-like n=1 Tax=Erpetoichthys calabaricus TaxID=27687 RepID=A0A8C4TK89_ERPCA
MQTCDFYLLIFLPVLLSSAQTEEKLMVTLMLVIEGKFVYSEDSVTLECRIEDALTDWIYRWYKGSERNEGTQIKGVNGHTYTIESVTQDESGVYRCEVYGNSPPHYSEFSNPVELTVQERTVRLDVISSHTDGRIFEGDQVSLQCHVNGNTVGWTYELHTNGTQRLYKKKMEGTFTINSVTLRHRTFYWCQAGKGRLRMHSSDVVKLDVSELFSEPHLTVHPSPLVGYGHNVTLRCQSMTEFPEKQLVYQFYKETASISPKTSQNEFTIQSFQMEDTGSYWCDVAVKGTEKKRSNQVQVPELQSYEITVDYTTGNAIRLGLSGLVLLVLLVLVSDCFWNRVLSKGNRSQKEIYNCE